MCQSKKPSDVSPGINYQVISSIGAGAMKSVTSGAPISIPGPGALLGARHAGDCPRSSVSAARGPGDLSSHYHTSLHLTAGPLSSEQRFVENVSKF